MALMKGKLVFCVCFLAEEPEEKLAQGGATVCVHESLPVEFMVGQPNLGPWLT